MSSLHSFAWLCLACGLAAQDPAPPLRFVHISDTHLPRRASEDYVRELLDRARATGAAFSIHTGDITEFGGRRAAWPGYLALFDGTELPHFDALGNHDQTWDGLADRLRQRFGAPYYRFDRGGVTFFCLNSASYQDPRPSFGEEQLRWLAAELDALPRTARIALFLHHPLGTNEFATRYEVQRLCSLLLGRDVLAFFVGHGHRARSGRIAAWPWVMGGSTFGGDQGHGACTVDAERVRYVYDFRDTTREPVVLLDQELAGFTPFEVAVAVEREGDRLVASVTAGDRAPVFRRVRLHVDFAEPPAATGELGERLAVDVAGLVPGVHVLTAELQLAAGGEHFVVQEFEVAAPPTARLQPLWQRRLPEALQGPLAAVGDVLACVGNAGVLRGLALTTGEPVWQHALGGPAPGGVATDRAGGFVTATLDGVVVRVAADGAVAWRVELAAPFAAAPLVVGEVVLCVDLDGRGHALDFATGRTRWQRAVADYAIEKPPVVLDDRRVVFGAWDTRVHAVALADGSPSWSLRARGARAAAARYYSPADCSPAVLDGKVFVADRKFELTVTDLDGHELGGDVDVASLVAHAPSHTIFVRRGSGSVAAIDSRTLTPRWQRELPVGRTPTPVTVAGPFVHVIGERDGVLYVLDAATGELLDRHRVNVGHYPFAPVLVVDATVVTAGMDGHLRAFHLRRS